MAGTTKVAKRPCSPRKLAAQRANARLSTGPRSILGKAKASMGNYSHGMRSAKLIVPGECPVLFRETKQKLLAAINPTDPVSEMLANRVVKRHWYSLRGERALNGQAAERIDAIVDGAGERAASAVRRLAPLIDSDSEAVHQLRLFPEGVAYLRQQYTILRDRLATGRNLLHTERLRCFTLAGKRPEQVLKGDRVATEILRAQIGIMHGQEGTLEEVAEFLGDPPDGMPADEFAIRAQELADSVEPTEASFRRLTSCVNKALTELKSLQAILEEAAEASFRIRRKGPWSIRPRRGPGS